MIPAYPQGLPLPLRNGYAFEPVNAIRSTPMDSGRSRQRVEFQNVPSLITLSWIFNPEEARLFQAWAMQVVGAGWFTLTMVTPLGFDTQEVRFRQTPKGGELLGRYSWGFSVDCELRKTPLLDPGWAEILPDYVLYADVFDYAVNQQWPDNFYQTSMDVFDFAANEQWPNA